MSATSRIAIVGTVAWLATISASCEALVGIHDKELFGPDASVADASEGAAGSETSLGADSANDAGADGEGADAALEADEEAAQPDGAEDGGTTDEAASPGDGGDAGDGSIGDAHDGGVGGAMDAADANGPSDAGDGAAPMDPDLPCAQQPTFLFCDDFDTESLVSEGWGYSFVNLDGGVLQFATVNVSPPRSVQAILPPMATGVGEAQLGKDVGVLSNSVRLAFDFRLDVASLTNVPQIGIAQLIVGRAGSTMSLDYIVGPGATSQLQAYVGDAGAPLVINSGAPPVQRWTRVAISYDSSAGLSLYQNGALVGTRAVGSGAPGDVTAIIGGVFVNPSGTATMTLEMDNVVVSGR
jgi:hypothetical protein